MNERYINVNGNEQIEYISVLDHGLLYGHGLFETLRAYRGNIFRLQDHLTRLYESASVLNWTLPWTQGLLETELCRAAELYNKSDAYLRITVTRGVGPMGPDPSTCAKPSFIIFAQPYIPPPTEIYRQGWRAVQSSIRKNSTSPLSRIKSLQFLDSVIAKQEARMRGAQEGIMLNEYGDVAEGTMSNLFLVIDGVLVTPEITSGILPGVTRKAVLEIARKGGISTVERRVTIDDVCCAEELFCTSSLIELMPITYYDERIIGSGRAGQTTRLLHRWYQDLRSKSFV